MPKNCEFTLPSHIGCDRYQSPVTSVVRPRGEMPDEWRLGQIHKEVQVVAQLCKESLLQVALQVPAISFPYGYLCHL